MHVVYYPDPVLQRLAEPVPEGWSELRAFAEEMLRTMKEAGGVGLAAPQVGESLRLFVASDTGEIEDGRVFANPRIEPHGPIVDLEEGCLSLPGMNALIRRPEKVRVSWTDIDGTAREGDFDGLLARIIQHEFDHLEGVLFFERMTPADQLRVRPELRTFEEQYVER